jgi:hypothetical protein
VGTGEVEEGGPRYTIIPSATTSPERLVLESTLVLDTGSFLSVDPPENFLINEAIVVTGVASRVLPLTLSPRYVSSLVKGGGYIIQKLGENSIPFKPSYKQEDRNRKR